MANTKTKPPELFNVDAENGLVHAVLTDPVLLEIREVEGVQWHDFWLHKNQRAWMVIERMRRDGLDCDHIAVADELRRLDSTDADVYADHVMGLLTDLALTHNARQYARIVADWARQRAAREAITDLARSFGSDGKFDGSLGATVDRLQEIHNGAGGSLGWQPYTMTDALAFNEPTEFAIAGLFELPSLSICYGYPGCFKTLLMTEAALCVAAGIPWLDPLPGQSGPSPRQTTLLPALWLDFDNGAKRMHRRLAALAREHYLDPDSLPFHYVCLPTPWLDGTDWGSMNALARFINAGSYGFVVVDNLGCISGGADENDAGEMATIFSHFRRVVEDTGAAVIVIHHERKATGGRPGDALRGSTAIGAALDLGLRVDREPGSDLATMYSTKTRGADVLPFGALWTYTQKPGSLDLEGARFYGMPVDDTTSDHAIREAVLDIVTTMPGINSGDLQSELQQHLDAGRDRIRRVIRQLAAEGKLRTETGAHNATEHYPI